MVADKRLPLRSPVFALSSEWRLRFVAVGAYRNDLRRAGAHAETCAPRVL